MEMVLDLKELTRWPFPGSWVAGHPSADVRHFRPSRRV